MKWNETTFSENIVGVTLPMRKNKEKSVFATNLFLDWNVLTHSYRYSMYKIMWKFWKYFLSITPFYIIFYNPFFILLTDILRPFEANFIIHLFSFNHFQTINWGNIGCLLFLTNLLWENQRGQCVKIMIRCFFFFGILLHN